MGFSWQGYWSGLPFPSPGDLPNPGIEPGLPHCWQMLYPLSHQENPLPGMIIQPLISSPNTTHSLSSVQFGLSVMSNSLQTHGMKHARPPCPSPTPGIYSNSCPLSQVMPPNQLILCHPLLLLLSIFPRIRFFSNESPLRLRWPKYWSFSFSISPSNEHPGAISFRMD